MAELSQVIGELWKIHEATGQDLPVYLTTLEVPEDCAEFVCMEQIICELDDQAINTALDV